MALAINTNIASLSSQNSMNKAQEAKETAMERLTTGKRINSAADDAAGLAIANKMTSQIKGLNQAVRNSNDGISMLQTAAGGLEESKNILQRMRELSVQSASGTYKEDNRGAMQDEVEALKSELTRISETTTFNGIKILDGSQDDTKIQAGANANETIGFSIGSTAANDIGGTARGDIEGTEAGANLLAGLKRIDNTLTDDTHMTMKIDDQSVGNLTGADTLDEALGLINDRVEGVEVTAFTEVAGDRAGNGVIAGADKVTFSLANADGTTTAFEIKDTQTMDEVVSQINEKSGGALKAELTENNRLVLSNESGAAVTIGEAGTTAQEAIGIAAGTANASLSITSDTEEAIKIEYNSAEGSEGSDSQTLAEALGLAERLEAGKTEGGLTTANIGDLAKGELVINDVAIGAVAGGTATTTAENDAQAANLAEAINKLTSEHGVFAEVVVAVPGAVGTDEVLSHVKLTSHDGKEISMDYSQAVKDNAARQAVVENFTGFQIANSTESQNQTVDDIDISTDAGAQQAIKTLDVALEQVSKIESELGAVENRLSFTVSNLSNVSENASAARSRIEDTDYASESAQLSRAQVLQQAGQAMLSQANSAPQQVLSLLQ